ncbi:MAG: hypothetical protein AABX86_00750 [Nanoarchaeota archaeon]
MKSEQLILEKLEKIEKEVGEIKEHMIDANMIDASIKHEKDGKLVSLEDIENVRNKTR